MTDQLFRVRIFTPGATGTSSSNVDFTLQTALAEAPTVSTPLIRPLEGRAEAAPWEVSVVDHGSSFSADLADSSGRLDLLTRLIKVQRNRNDAGWTDVGTGRIADVFLGDDVASYRIVVEDERILERQATVFNTTNTTRLYPPGPHTDWANIAAPPKGTIHVVARTANTAKIRFDWTGLVAPTQSLANLQYFPAPETVFTALEEDLRDPILANSTLGSYKHLRVRVGNTDYPVRTFLTPEDLASTASGVIAETVEALRNQGPVPQVEVVATSSQLGTGNTYTSAFMHMFTAPPSLACPLHIGGSTGITVGNFIERIYDGEWSSSGTILPRVSTSALDAVKALPLPLVRYRITDADDMDDILERRAYQPFMLVPFIDTDGKIAPKSVALPGSSTGVTFTFTKANLAAHPTWSQIARELVTVLEVEPQGFGFPLPGNTDRVGGDGIAMTDRGTPHRLTHDRANILGHHVLKIEQFGLADQLPAPQSSIDLYPTQTPLSAYLGFIRHEIFNRFGDGPVYGSLVALSTAGDVEPGDFVKVNLASFPNPQISGRGGTRIVQVLQREDTPAGPTFQYLDAGPDLQSLSAPTLTLSTSTSDPKHVLQVVVNGLSSQGASRFHLQMANSTSLPASTSTLWVFQETSAFIDGTYNVGRRPSGETFFARARALKPGRFPSAWTNSTGKTTASITAPTALAMSSNLATWTVGDSQYPTEFFGDTATSASPSASNRVAILPAGSNRYRVEGVTSTGTVRVWVRHRDAYGGASNTDSTTFVRSLPTLDGLLGFHMLFGRST